MGDRNDTPVMTDEAHAAAVSSVNFNSAIAELRNTSSLRSSHYLGDHMAITSTIYGHKIFVDTRDISLAPHILVDGKWEMGVTEVFRRLIRGGMTVVDIGANFGWYTLIAASLVGPKGHVIAFEPNPDVHNLLHRSLEVNGYQSYTTLERKGVMEVPKVLTFHKWARHQASGNFFWGNPSPVHNDTTEAIQVECTSLDEYFREHPRGRVDVIKIDAEGSEPQIIDGADFTLHVNPRIQLLLEYNSLVRPTAEKLMRKGFRMAHIEDDASLRFMNLDQLDQSHNWHMLLFTR
ncbi:FkbM family methyltransferase [candidate division KSB1 bacterium]|nr:MAG: FkbM family methyltransferase [candidate division KSB1 bacterium]